MSLDIYTNLMKQFHSSLPNKRFFFEVSKCCGYSEIIDCPKVETLENLYAIISDIFQVPKDKLKLYILHENSKILIVRTNVKIKDFLSVMQDIIKPEYPLPSQIVYKIYFDDGTCHKDHTTNLDCQSNIHP